MHIMKLAAALLMVTTALQGNTLIVTRGPVSRGLGAVLAKEIQRLDNSYKIVRQNDICQRVDYEFLYRVFPENMSFLESVIDTNNLIYAIWKGDVYFKDGVDNPTKHYARSIIEQIQRTLSDIPEHKAAIDIAKKTRVISELASYAASNENVVWETGLLFNFDEEAAILKMQFTRVIETITYFPLNRVVQKLLQRNFDANCNRDATDKRLLQEALTSFFALFQPATDETQADQIVLTRDEFDNLIRKSACYIKAVRQPRVADRIPYVKYEFNFDELEAFRDSIYEQFNFGTVDSVILVPSLPYDFLLKGKEECIAFAKSLIASA